VLKYSLRCQRLTAIAYKQQGTHDATAYIAISVLNICPSGGKISVTSRGLHLNSAVCMEVQRSLCAWWTIRSSYIAWACSSRQLPHIAWQHAACQCCNLHIWYLYISWMQFSSLLWRHLLHMKWCGNISANAVTYIHLGLFYHRYIFCWLNAAFRADINGHEIH
jgi:hypothetical protein